MKCRYVTDKSVVVNTNLRGLISLGVCLAELEQVQLFALCKLTVPSLVPQWYTLWERDPNGLLIFPDKHPIEVMNISDEISLGYLDFLGQLNRQSIRRFVQSLD